MLTECLFDENLSEIHPISKPDPKPKDDVTRPLLEERQAMLNSIGLPQNVVGKGQWI